MVSRSSGSGPRWTGPLAVFLVAALAAGLWAFEPWRAFTSSTVDEALPGLSSSRLAAPDDVVDVAEEATGPLRRAADRERVVTPTPSATPVPVPEVVELGSGPFEDAEHDTDGVARILELADGSRFVRLEDFSTSDGPDVFVGLSDSPSGGSWGSYDDLRYVQLGSLKATDGNQNYEIPAGVDLAGFRSVVIWCDRFDVAFGTAPVVL